MKECANLDEFIKLYHKDVLRVLHSKFQNIIKRFDTLEDCTQSLYLHLQKSKAVERFDPKFKVLFSTYMIACIKNFMFLYHEPTHKEQFRYSLGVLPEKYEEHFSYDFEGDVLHEIDKTHVRKLLVGKDRKYSCKRKLTVSQLWDYYINGWIDADIRKELNTSQTYVMLKKKELVKVLLSEFKDSSHYLGYSKGKTLPELSTNPPTQEC